MIWYYETKRGEKMATSQKRDSLRSISPRTWLLLFLAVALVLLALSAIFLAVNLFISNYKPLAAGTYKPVTQVIVEFREFNDNQWSEWDQVKLIAERPCQVKIKAQKAELRLLGVIKGMGGLSGSNSSLIFVTPTWPGSLRLSKEGNSIFGSGQGSFKITIDSQPRWESIPRCTVELNGYF